MPDVPARAPVVRGLVLAGGRSRRMGRDKAAIVIDGDTLLERAVSLLARVVPDVQVSIRPEQADDRLRRNYALLLDAEPDSGPAGGLLAAHAKDPSAAWLVLACDMPGVDQPLLAQLVAARDPARAATAWRSPADGRPEPLCAIWEPVTLARLAEQARLAARADPGEGAAAGLTVSPRELLSRADTLLLDSPRPAALESLNTPADLDRYREHMHGHEPQEDHPQTQS